MRGWDSLIEKITSNPYGLLVSEGSLETNEHARLTIHCMEDYNNGDLTPYFKESPAHETGAEIYNALD